MSDILKKRNDTIINFTYNILPVKNIKKNTAGLLGDFNSEFIKNFYSDTICNKINVVVSELINNVIENIVDYESRLMININLNKHFLIIKISNKVDYEQFKLIKAHINKINESRDLKRLFTETMKENRENGKKGGLGLIRLAFEEKASLIIRYSAANSYISITAKIII